MDYSFDASSSAFGRLVSSLERVATGFAGTEGPIWLGDQLLFNDIPNNRTVRFRQLKEGPEITTFRTPTGNANGQTLDRQGHVLACEHSGRRVSRVDRNGRAETVVDNYEGKRFNSPNDVIVRSDGTIYFTDPPYGLPRMTEGKELPFNGVYRIDPDGKLDLIASDFERPNGLALSPDEKTLYVDDSYKYHIRAFDVAPDGSVSNSRVWAELKAAAGETGVPDGMKVDQEGNVYCTGPGGVWIFGQTGRLLGKIRMPEVTRNLAWADDDWRTMYMTGIRNLYRIRLHSPGIPVGPSRS